MSVDKTHLPHSAEAPVPVWATSMVGNYRRMYREHYGTHSGATDAQIWGICNTVYDDNSIEEEDKARVESMRELIVE